MAELTTLARPYAKASFESALYTDNLQTWSDMLSLAAAVVNTDTVKAALSSPSMTAEQQAQVVIDVCGDEINAALQSLITVLAENKRLSLLSEIVALFETMKANQEKTIDVEVSTAFALGKEAEQKLATALKDRLQRDVKLHSEVDESLIGGIVVRAGDLVIDGSVRTKLGKLAETMNS